MNEEEKKAVKYFYNLRATIDESNMLFDKEINVKHGKETIKQITIILNLIEKLQKENEELKESYMCAQACANMVFDKIIPVQKVKDKIEELNKKEQKLQNSISAEEREEYSDANISWDLMDINIKREVLQELIEEREEK